MWYSGRPLKAKAGAIPAATTSTPQLRQVPKDQFKNNGELDKYMGLPVEKTVNNTKGIMAPHNVSICKAGDGILETHVTWEDIERNMQTSLCTKATFGPNKKVKNIGEGNGFMSKICLIEADWKHAGADEKLPEKFVAKICTLVTVLAYSQKAMDEQSGKEEMFEQWIDMINQMETQTKESHNTEINVYKLFEKYGLQEKMAMCKLYHLQKFTDEDTVKGNIIMEFKDDLQPVHIYNNLPIEALYQPLRSLAAMGAASLRFKDEERSWFKTTPFTEIFGKWLGEDKVEMFTSMVKQVGEGKLDENVERLLGNIKSILDVKKYDAIPNTLGMRPILCHGDLWSANVLWKKPNDHYKMNAIIDYQTSHFGSPSIDLVRLLSTALSGKDRREHSAALLEKYYGFLLEELNGEKAPFTLEQLKEAFKLYFPLGAYIVLPMFGTKVELTLKDPTEERKEEAQKLLFEKAECLLQDMLDCLDKRTSV